MIIDRRIIAQLTLFNRRSINTVGSGTGTNSGGTCPARSAGKLSCCAPPLKGHLKSGGALGLMFVEAEEKC